MIKFFPPALCLVLVLIALTPAIQAEKGAKGVVVLACITILLGVAGSDTGLFLKLSGGLILLIPLLGILFWQAEETDFNGVRVTWRPILILSALIIMSMSAMIRFGGIYHVGEGLTLRFKAVHPVDHPLMNGIFTTRDRAEHIKRVSLAIKQHLRPDNTLFIYGHEPLFYYLNATPPATTPYWMANQLFGPQTLFQNLEDAIARTGRYPLMVVTDSKVLGDEGALQLEAFLNTHNYACLDRGGNVEIWNVPQRQETPAEQK